MLSKCLTNVTRELMVQEKWKNITKEDLSRGPRNLPQQDRSSCGLGRVTGKMHHLSPVSKVRKDLGERMVAIKVLWLLLP